jgi:[acyl-carrier-protein] S-malonyltransferase
MKSAALQLAEYLKAVSIKTPNIAVLHNADVASYSDAIQIKDALTRQLYSPVRWVETIQKMANMHITQTAECGPGKVLAGLTKRIVAELPCTALTTEDSLISYVAALNN